MGLFNILQNILKDPQEDIIPEGDATRLAELDAELERLRPALRADGGNITIVAVTEAGDVHLKMVGACSSCHSQASTMLQYVEPELKRKLDWVQHVRSV